ncbi:family 16 glycosylhydrolase [Maribacter sp. R77961]|uniref:family 16 glycosylhydrolase n=1 Tax=Maribacter sp. R77961 TaxID=3093871 RepID=UPI0037C9F167
MKKNFATFIFSMMSIIAVVVSCKNDDDIMLQGTFPENLVVDTNVSTDGSGVVEITPSANNAVTFIVSFEPDAANVVVGRGETATYKYTMTGQSSYDITVTAYSIGGGNISSTITIDLEVSPQIDPEVLQNLAGDGSKRWVWARTTGGHFGVGPNTGDFPEFFSATPNSLNPCLYDDVLVFSFDDNGTLTYTLDPGADGQVFVNWTEVNRFFPEASPEQFVDECRDISAQASFQSEFNVTDNVDGTRTLSVGDSFLSYWAVISGEYQITELTENKLTVRGLSQPFNGDDPLAWYSTFVPEGDTSGGDPLVSVFSNLVWSDEFDADGAPDPANWTYDLGNGDNGWGNGELQSYTDDASNVIVEEGNLKITARAEASNGQGIYYFDDLQLFDAGGVSQGVIQDFEGAAPAFTDFGGAFSAVIANPDASGVNTSATVAQTTKPQGSETFAASFFDVSTAIAIPANPQLRLKTWSPIANAVVRIKLEDSTNGENFVEVDATTTVTGAWEELTFDFSAAGAFNYDRVVIFFDFGNPGTAGAGFSSARIKTEGLQEFTYGRVAARAKLPTGGGTWPAIWMLGGDYLTNPWPAAGEMDIMEHVGNQQDIVFASTHDPNNFGGNARTGSTLVEGASDEFHLYEMEWTETEIKFAVDGIVYHTVSNDGTLPFNKDFFFILNVAMGGNFGGTVDPSFTESTMEIDYIRMYQ